MPKVTIIVPAYNAEQYIQECANSILNQTLDNIEAIFIDDGSTDDTGNILDEITCNSPFAKVIHQKNRGLYKTRETGLSLAKGDYVGWVDADDFVDKSMFEKLYSTAIARDSELVYCDYCFYPKKIKTKERWFRPYLGVCDVDFIERNIQPWNKIVKRSLLEELNVGRMFETCFDEAYLKVMLHAKNPVSLSDELYFYRVGNGTMSSSYKNISHYESFIESSKNLKSELKGETDYWQAYLDYRIIYYTLMTMLVAANSGNEEHYEKLREDLISTCNYKDNRFIDHILIRNFGNIKAFAIKNLIAQNYQIAQVLARISLRE